ncbi:MAG: P1 family peptidase [Alphaproteobacteria bacterium]|nr:P1 family peptidase [Alphaproteobacteria bacterium]MBU2084272.1 P1 family peptidase [Alphaproteobacteria bacterium]MBU2141410.1 P1 family peptidase [Alphaproteobacteria bacterium]MBU2197348.1 P1 family peptidase [Alphaproteobacteria bacterium]
MAKPGKNNLITDVAGISVGQAEDARVRTGATVILAEKPAVAAVCVAGGGPGTRETDLLAGGTLVDVVDAICLSGGSAFGLAAADGVAAGLKKAGRGFGLIDLPTVPKSPIVPAAILYDLANGGDKDWGDASPYAALGRTAYDNASGTFRLGRAGAGYGAAAGAHLGGTGSASIVTKDKITVGALAAVNCYGSVYMPGTDAFWAWPYEIDGEFGGARPPSDFSMNAEDWGAAKLNPSLGQNTTIACIATDAILTPDQAKRVAQMALSGFSRAIRPVFAPFDGDAVFVLATGKRALPDPTSATVARIGELAASTLARAIARGVYMSGR